MCLTNNSFHSILENKKQIYLILYLFVFLYAPPIIFDFNIVILLFFFSIALLFLKYKDQMKKIYQIKKIRYFLLGLVIYSIYFFIIIIINYIFFQRVQLIDYLTIIYSYSLFFPVTITCIIYIICFCMKYEINLDNLIRYFIYASLIQAIIAILALIFRDFKEVLLSIMHNHTNNDLLVGDWLNHRRFFGFSRNLLDQFGLGTGVMCGIAILQIRNYKNYVLYIPFLFLLTFLNAKTGIVIIILSFIIYIFNKKNRKECFSFLKKYKFKLLLLTSLFIGLIYYFTPSTFEWIINDFISFLPNSQNEGIASLLFSNGFWSLPSSLLQIIFGTGHNVFAVSGFPHSDVGYVNEIWKTGIVGFVILYGTIFILFLYLIKSKVYIKKYIGILFMISFFIFMIKGQVVGYNPATPLIFTISLYALI